MKLFVRSNYLILKDCFNIFIIITLRNEVPVRRRPRIETGRGGYSRIKTSPRYAVLLAINN